MANRDAAFGLRPIGHLNGNPWNGQTRKFLVEDDWETVGLFIGDPVLISGTAPSDDPTGYYPAITKATLGTDNAVSGVVVSFDPIDAADTEHTEVYRVNKTSRYANVVVDPDVIYIIQDDASATLTGEACTQNANLADSAGGNTSTGISRVELDATAPGIIPADQLLILGIWPEEGNALGDHCIWEVIISRHSFRPATGILGV